MKELKRNLTDSRDNALARLFHKEVKTLVRNALFIIDSMPELKMDDLEYYNSREWLNLRDYFLAHERDPRNRRIINGAFKFLIFLREGDEFWRQRTDRGTDRIKVMPFKEGEPIRPEWWREE